jgi:hypothetical protein
MNEKPVEAEGDLDFRTKMRDLLMGAAENRQQLQQSKTWHEDQFIASINVSGELAGGGMQSADIELACTQEVFDASGRYTPDPLASVIRRAADALEEKLANGKINAFDIFSFNVSKTLNRTINQEDIHKAEIKAGFHPSM